MSEMSVASATYRFRVRYFETDQMQVAHHAHYFVWFEASRSEFCRKYGIDYSQMEKHGLFMPIIDAQCRYKAAAKYDDEVSIFVYVVERTKRTLKLKYEVTCEGRTLAEGETTQMLIDTNGKPRSFPDEIASRFDGNDAKLSTQLLEHPGYGQSES